MPNQSRNLVVILFLQYIVIILSDLTSNIVILQIFPAFIIYLCLNSIIHQNEITENNKQFSFFFLWGWKKGSRVAHSITAFKICARYHHSSSFYWKRTLFSLLSILWLLYFTQLTKSYQIIYITIKKKELWNFSLHYIRNKGRVSCAIWFTY